MQLGIFAKTFSRPTVASNLDAIVEHGFRVTQYNLACAGLATLPDSISPRLVEEIRQSCKDRGLTMAAISATFNIIDPDCERRQANLRRLSILAEAAPSVGASILTLCTGTCDPQDMWKGHPDNASAGAWNAMVKSISSIVSIAESAGVTVAIEPEPSNVVESARSARRLLDEIGSPRLKIVMDGANLIDSPDPSRMRDVLDEAIELLGPDIVLAHAKDVTWVAAAQHCPAGTGMLDYEHYLAGLSRCGFEGPLVLHGLAEDEVATCRGFLQHKMAQLGSAPRSSVPMAGVN